MQNNLEESDRNRGPVRGSGQKRDIQERTFAFAVRVLKVVNVMPKSTGGYVLARQLARSGTSVGANVEEAESAHSKAEFVRKINIARGEARESAYWIRLIAESGMVPKQRLRLLMVECNEIVKILSAIVRNARRE